jgi:hypothetical protein
VEFIGACGVVLSSSEWLVNVRHLRNEALLGWPISQLRHHVLAQGFVPRVLNPLFRYPGVTLLIIVRLVSALFLVAGIADNFVHAALIFTVALTTIGIALRSPFGLDGSDQMAAFIFATLFLEQVCPGRAVESTFLWVIALQSCLAYFTAGFAKLVSPTWRDGSAVFGIASTRMYGVPSAARWIKEHGWFCVGVAWSVILTECLFPLALVAPFPLVVALLAGGGAFHVMSGFTMGLNTFVWSFFATYPAILWCHSRIY